MMEPAPIVQKNDKIYSGHGELFVKAVRDCKSLTGGPGVSCTISVNALYRWNKNWANNYNHYCRHSFRYKYTQWKLITIRVNQIVLTK